MIPAGYKFGVNNLAEATTEWLKLPVNCKSLTGAITRCSGGPMLLSEIFPLNVTRKVKFLKPYQYPKYQGDVPVETQDFAVGEEITIDRSHKLYPILLLLASNNILEEV